MDGGTLHKYLGTLSDRKSTGGLLSDKYYLPVDVGDPVEVTMQII